MNIKKKIGGFLLASSSLATAAVAFPNAAMALGWDAGQMIQDTTGSTGVSVNSINQTTLSEWVQSFTTFALGIAVVIFVLKVVLTAIDQMVFGGDGKTGGVLTKIPLIGAYDIGGGGNKGGFGGPGGGNKGGIDSWKDVWLHFAKNIAIVAGAWIIIQILMGAIMFVLSSASGTTGMSGN